MRASRKVRQKLDNYEKLMRGAVCVIRRMKSTDGSPDFFDIVSISDEPLHVHVDGMESRAEVALRKELEVARSSADEWRRVFVQAEDELQVLQERIRVLSNDLEALGATVGSWLKT